MFNPITLFRMGKFFFDRKDTLGAIVRATPALARAVGPLVAPVKSLVADMKQSGLFDDIAAG